MKRRLNPIRPHREGRLFSSGLEGRSSEFYEVAEDGSSITCQVCGFTSREPKDVRQKYCPACRVFHDDRMLMARLAEGYETVFQWRDDAWSWRSAA